jgi:hypothetical protein
MCLKENCPGRNSRMLCPRKQAMQEVLLGRKDPTEVMGFLLTSKRLEKKIDVLLGRYISLLLVISNHCDTSL